MRTSRPSNESTLLAASCATQLGYHTVLCAGWLVPISGRLTDHLKLKGCFVSNFRIAIQTEAARSAKVGMDMQSVDSSATTPADAVELKRTDQAACPLGFLIRAYRVFSGAGATCEAAAAPAGGLVSGSSRNLRIICGASGEVMKL